MGLVNNGKIVAGAAPSGGDFYPFPIGYAGKFIEGAYLDWTPSSGPTDNDITTFSFWVKLFPIATNLNYIYSCGNDGTHRGQIYRGSANEFIRSRIIVTTDQKGSTTGAYRDVSQWYHVLVQHNTSAGTAESDRIRIYINGVQDSSVTDIPALSSSWYQLAGTVPQSIGRYLFAAGYDLNGYLAEFHAVDGQVIQPEDFGEFVAGTWVPKEYTGSYGNNGFYLNFADSGDLGKDVSGNANHWTNTNVEQTTDTPTNNFPTFDINTSNLDTTISKAGLYISSGNSAIRGAPLTTFIPTTGKWKAEFLIEASSQRHAVGVTAVEDRVWTTRMDYNGYVYYYNGSIYHDGVATPLGSTYGVGDIMTVIVDSDAGEIEWKINNVSQGTTSIDSSKLWAFQAGDIGASDPGFVTLINGAEGFTYTDVDALPICTENWPTPEVIDSEEGLFIEAYAGDGAASKNITGAAFDPSGSSLAWIKNRDTTATHILYDTERGAQNYISSPSTAAEVTDTNDGLLSFLTNGVEVGFNAINIANSNHDFILWLFNMLPAYGMDIVSYTGTGVAGLEVPHSLGVAPELVIVKTLDSVNNWVVYHKDSHATAPEDNGLLLNATNAITDTPVYWNDTAPDASNFTVGSGTAVNINGENYVAYLFRSVPGFLKVGYYTGNGSADGPRIHTGFRVRYLMHKRADATSGWSIRDSARMLYNEDTRYLQADTTAAEAVLYPIDFLSNGAKVRTTVTGINASGGRYIYLAIGDAFPYVNAF